MKSVKEKVDEIIVVDTGSIDNTTRIAECYGAKVLYFPWNGSFSDARNYSIKQAAGNWVLVLDADEELRCESDELRALVKDTAADAYNFETVNYVGDDPDYDVVNSINIRLVRNNRGYFYYNKIHEQIGSSILSINPYAMILPCNIKVYHYGYLNANIDEKNKCERNKMILENELKLCPSCVFTLYHLGSEYCRLENIEEATELFERAYQYFNPKDEFGPSLILKMACCYMELERYGEALILCDTGLKYYPTFTDLEFMKGEMFREIGNIKQALWHYKRCCEMGEAPAHLGGIEGVGSYRPLSAISELYLELGEFDEAEKYVNLSLQEKTKLQRQLSLNKYS